MFVNHTNKSK